MCRFAVLLVLVVTGFAGCANKRTLGNSGTGTAGAPAGIGGGSGSTGSGGGVTPGAGGGAIAGSGGGAIAGSSGGATAGAGGANAGAGGATAGAGGSSAMSDPLRLLIFYTRWGTSYPEWWPTGSDRNFSMSAMLQPLEAHKNDIILVSGLGNASLIAGAADAGPRLEWAQVVTGDSMRTLLTGRSVDPGGPAQGPSLDTVIGDCGGMAGPPLRLAVGQLGYDNLPGLSFDRAGSAIPAERDPQAVALRVLGHNVSAPSLTGDINVDYPGIGAAQMGVAVEALATAKTCAVTLLWGEQVTLRGLGLTVDVPTAADETSDLYDAIYSASAVRPGNPFVTLQNWYAQQFASLLDRLAATPLGSGTLLDRSVVVWISDSGAGYDDEGLFIPVVIAGRGGGRLDVGRFFEVVPHVAPPGTYIDIWTITRTQGDLLAALAGLWGIASFGDPQIARQPLTEILKP